MAKQNRNISFNTSAYKQHRFQAQHLKGLTSKYNARTTSYRISNTTSKQQHQQVKLWLNVKIFPIKINKFVNISNSPLFNFCSASFCVCVCVCEQQTPIFSNQKHFFSCRAFCNHLFTFSSIDLQYTYIMIVKNFFNFCM